MFLFFVNYGLLVFAKSRSAECLEGCTPTCMFQCAVEQGKGRAGEETGEMGTEAHGRRKRRDGERGVEQHGAQGQREDSGRRTADRQSIMSTSWTAPHA